MQPLKIHNKRQNMQILHIMVSQIKRYKLLQSIIISGLLFPFIVGFSPLLIDNIDIVAIRDMQLRHEGKDNVLDTIIVIRNSNENTLKLENCTFDLAFALSDSEDIPLGRALKEEIFLERQVDSMDAYTDTEVRLSVSLDQDIQTLSQTLMTKKEIVGLLAESKPKLNLHLKGRFDVGIKANRAWGYQPGITIDWIVKPEVQRDILAKVFSTMTPGSKPAAAIPEATPSPVTAAPISKETSDLDVTRKITIYFALGAKTFDDDAREKLQKWAEKQQELSKDMILHVEGHTDKKGDEQKNLKISIERADTVCDYLTDTLNMSWKRVVIEGFGETQPVVTGDSEEAHAKNRRVELYVSYE